MPEQETHEAEVLLGRRGRYTDALKPFSYFGGPAWENTYTLIIDGNYHSGDKDGRPAEIALQYAKIMRDHDIFEYSLVNGERIRFTNKKRIKVSRMLPEDVDEFIQTLDANLRE